MVALRHTEAGPLRLLAQECTQPSSRELVDDGESAGARMFEVVEPSPEYRIEAFDDAREAVATRAFCLGPDTVFETLEALLANMTHSSFKPVAEELEPFSSVAAGGDMRLVWMQTEGNFRQPSTELHQ